MFLDVGNGHTIYFEEYGNPNGIKILFLHGGPGLGFSDNDKVLFDPEKFHVIFIDQRGCGKSLTKGKLEDNTTSDLVSDTDLVLNYLDIDSVIVFGGSWGATLGVLYAARFPKKVDKLILRGFFPATKACTDIYLRGKIKDTHPENWERVASIVPQDFKDREAEFFFKAIDVKDSKSQALGYMWARYGFSLSRRHITDEEIDEVLIMGEIDLDRIRIELNYALNEFFIPEGQVYEQALKIKNIPVVIIHGTFDYLCPLEYAEKLAERIEGSRLIVLDEGHSLSEKKIKEAITKELNQL